MPRKDRYETPTIDYLARCGSYAAFMRGCKCAGCLEARDRMELFIKIRSGRLRFVS